ncbi:protein of unknown function [Cupriavidus taiwanensis]|uniref:Uncharacterized protein n=1 Tax=Cupriavidus taiwanensis TaxID=164546 RepID=A0A375ICZ1_9BURK|nr:hypothetical protein [Cupriavidus taiwanensis]SPK72656.1 protein of unknown function [Cupriavidus taiwanensis]
MIAKKELGRTQGPSTPQPIASGNYMTNDDHWISRLLELAARHAHLGVSADLASLTRDELRGVYRFLMRIEETA